MKTHTKRNSTLYSLLLAALAGCSHNTKEESSKDRVYDASKQDSGSSITDRILRNDHTILDYGNAKLKSNIEKGLFEKGFLEDLEGMCGRLDMNCMGVLSVMDYETEGSFRPDIKSKASSGVGLIQLTKDSAKGVDTTTKQLSKMSQREQLKYVEKYFVVAKRENFNINYALPEDVALSVFYPSAAGKGDYDIGVKSCGSRMASQNYDKIKGIGDNKTACSRFNEKVYRKNRSLDQNKDGRITSAEYVVPALNRGYMRMYARKL